MWILWEKKFSMLKEVFWVEIGYFRQNSIKEKRGMTNDNAFFKFSILISEHVTFTLNFIQGVKYQGVILAIYRK